MREQPTRIINQEELDDLLKDLKEGSTLNCFVQLNFGLRSSKEISFNANGDYSIFNEIDGSEETIEHDNLMSTFIGEALEKGALYEY